MAWLVPALGMLSCAPPKAIVVQEAVANKPPVARKQEPASAEVPSLTAAPNDGIRLPNMLGMPGENELRSSRPGGASNTGSGPVIARPPANTDP